MVSEIVRMYGSADEHELEFSPTPAGVWEVFVPPDVTDGMYIVEIFADAKNGEQAYWTGVLYLCQGTPCLEVKPDSVSIRMAPERSGLAYLPDRSELKFIGRNAQIFLKPDPVQIQRRRCACVRM